MELALHLPASSKAGPGSGSMGCSRREALLGLGAAAVALPFSGAWTGARAALPVIELLSGQRVRLRGSEREETPAGPQGVLRLTAGEAPGNPVERTELLDLVFEQVFGPLVEPAGLKNARIVLETDTAAPPVQGPFEARYRQQTARTWERQSAPDMPVRASPYAPLDRATPRLLPSGTEIQLEWISKAHIDRFGGQGFLLGLRSPIALEDRARLVPVMIEAWDKFLRQRIIDEAHAGAMVFAFGEPQRGRFHFRPAVAMEVRYTGRESLVDFTKPALAPLFEAVRAVEAGMGLHGLVDRARLPALQ